MLRRNQIIEGCHDADIMPATSRYASHSFSQATLYEGRAEAAVIVGLTSMSYWPANVDTLAKVMRLFPALGMTSEKLA